MARLADLRKENNDFAPDDAYFLRARGAARPLTYAERGNLGSDAAKLEQPLDVTGQEIHLEVHPLSLVERAQGRHLTRVGNEEERRALSLDGVHGERNAIHRERALLRYVTRELGAYLHLDSSHVTEGLDERDRPHSVDVPAHQVSTQAIRREQSALQVQGGVYRELTQGGARQGLGRQVRREQTVLVRDHRQTSTLNGDGLSEFERTKGMSDPEPLPHGQIFATAQRAHPGYESCKHGAPLLQQPATEWNARDRSSPPLLRFQDSTARSFWKRLSPAGASSSLSPLRRAARASSFFALHPLMTDRLRSVLFAGLALLSAGCGPSVRALHESNMHFEHCYSLDLKEEETDTERTGCWRNWRKHHAQQQRRDKVRYADERLLALERGLPGPRLPPAPATEIPALPHEPTVSPSPELSHVE